MWFHRRDTHFRNLREQFDPNSTAYVKVGPKLLLRLTALCSSVWDDLYDSCGPGRPRYGFGVNGEAVDSYVIELGIMAILYAKSTQQETRNIMFFGTVATHSWLKFFAQAVHNGEHRFDLSFFHD